MTPIYNVTPVPCFSKGGTEISVEMSVFTLWLDVKFIYLSRLYLFQFNDLIRTEDSRHKLLSCMEPVCLCLNGYFLSFKPDGQRLICL